jgi:starch synthase
MRVLFAAAEADPIIKVGGLGDVTGSLPRTLRSLEPSEIWGYTIDARLVIPFHPVIKDRIKSPELVASFEVPFPGGFIPAKAYLTMVGDLPVYLIDGEPVATVPSVYSLNTRLDGEKYVFFSLALLELVQALDWQPHILHAHDWHAALSVYALKLRRQEAFYARMRSILTIHNLPFMGASTEDALAAYGIPPVHDARLPDWGGYQPLPMGLSSADYLTTVSPTYAREILTPAFGSGLQDFLQLRAGTLTGILNGLDEQAWDPRTDTALARNYGIETLDERTANKKALRREMGLPEDSNAPLLIFIGRMDHQKGVDTAVEALRLTAGLRWQAVLLGTGDPALEEKVRSLESDYPRRIKAAIRFDAKLSRRMYAGGDMLLMPSRYEPCGLAQMIAMRYGCIPVARATGGLRDTVLDRADPASSTGYLFEGDDPQSLAVAIQRSVTDYDEHTSWRARQICGMQQDFSWPRFAKAYADLYARLLR